MVKIDTLSKLANKIIKELEEAIKKGEVRPSREVWVRRKIAEIPEVKHIMENGRVVPAIGHVLEQFTILNWSSSLSTFLKDVDRDPLFIEVVKSIVEDHENIFPPNVDKINQAKVYLRNFLYKLCEAKVNNEELDLDSWIDNFVKELNGAPVLHRLKAYLSGIYLGEDAEEIELIESAWLRKPKVGDIEYEAPLTIPLSEDKFVPNLPYTILELEMWTTKDADIFSRMNLLLHTLRLFKLGSIYVKSYYYIKESLFWPQKSKAIPTEGALTYSYTVEKDDADKLKDFVKVVYKALLKRAKERELRIALERYNDALLKDAMPEEKIAFAIAGLEALLGELGESKYKLSVRVAKLLSLLYDYDNAKDIRDDIKKAYKIRNSVVHGSEVKYGHELRPLLDRIMEYLRKSILIFLLTDTSPSKLKNLIEDSIVDNSSYEKLKDVINSIKLHLL